MFPLVQMFISRGVDPVAAKLWGDKYIHVMKRYCIDTPNRIAGFYANILVETGKLRNFKESLNYSVEALPNIWPSRFGKTEEQRQLAREWGYIKDKKTGKIVRPSNQQAIANYVYGDRGGNRGRDSGDGWKYRGHGPIQTTFLSNYLSVQEGTGVACVDNPEILTTPEGGTISSAYFWWKNKIYTYADRGDADGMRDLVNFGRKTAAYGDAHGFKEFLINYNAILDFIKNTTNNVIELPQASEE